MKKLILFAFLISLQTYSQYIFNNCQPQHIAGNAYLAGQRVSKDNRNYEAKFWTSTTPPSADWLLIEPCGSADNVLGVSYPNNKKIIGYMPSWNTTYNFNDYDPSKVTNVVVAFLSFKTNNTDYNSADFASIEFSTSSMNEVNNVLTTQQVLTRSHNVGTKVSVAVGGAIDYGFLWLMTKYYNDDAKLNEIAQYIVNYTNTSGIDGIDLDMECWWADPAITGTTEQGGRVRGDKWGTPDAGAHPAGIGLRKLAQKIKTLKPSLLLSAAVFGTSWYGNNYDDTIHNYLDWLGLMTYDFTGSWNDSPIGPHTALHKVPQGYTGQTANTPIYSVEDALEYWQGLVEPAWNHDGGFNVPRAKLCIGSPFYGYDLSTRKPAGNGYVTYTYKEIVNTYPTAPTSYDPLDPANFSGYISTGGKKIYYETPKSLRNKVKYIKDFGQQGIIIWELTNDLHPTNPNALLYNVFDENNLSITDNNLDNVSLYVSENTLYYSLKESSDKNLNFEIYNLLGQNVSKLNLDENNSGAIPLNLNKGVYIGKINNKTVKFIIK